MSDSRDSAEAALTSVLASLDQLNLSDNEYEIGQVKSKFGGSSDVHRGRLRKHDGSFVNVAIKRIRASLKSNKAFAKINQYTI